MTVQADWENQIDALALDGHPDAVALARLLWKREPVGRRVRFAGEEWLLDSYTHVDHLEVD